MNQRPTLSLKSPVKAAAPKLRASHARELKPALQTSFQTGLKPDSLAYSLIGAAQAVAQVRTGTNLPQALAQVWSKGDASPQARGAMQDIAYRCMRQLGQSEILIGLMAPKAPEPLVAALLACALALMTAPDEVQPYEEFTVVDQTVTAADDHPDTARAKGMVNAVLRRFLRERKALLETALLQPVAKWNYPQWWIDAAKAAWPQVWQDVLATGNTAPPLTLRVNVRKTSMADYLATLDAAGMAATQIGPYAVRLAKPVGVTLIPGFSDGLVSVQDAGAQLAAPLLDVRPGMRVLDACATPGGKAGHVLELADCALTALDSDPARAPRISDNLARLGLSARVVCADCLLPAGWSDGGLFERILLDAPCTASGVVKRHPDIKWLRRESDIAQLAATQGRMLDALWQQLAPGGKLLYATCSVFPQENAQTIDFFLARCNGARRLPLPGLEGGQLLPDARHDGFF